MSKHEKHIRIGEIIPKAFKDKAILDYACSSNQSLKQQIPLFSENRQSSDTRMCNVDIVIKRA